MRRRTATVALAGLLAAAALHSHAAAPAGEYEVKAAFLLNFARFAEWPASRLPAGAPLIFGVVGADPFGPLLEETLAAQSIDGHKPRVQRYARVDDIDVLPHVLFVSASESPRLPQLLSRLPGAGVLTVGDSEGFAARGGIIGLTVEGQHVRFEVNLAAAEASGVRLSAKLLRLARIVPDGAGGRP